MTHHRGSGIVCMLTLLWSQAGVAAANSCSDPYWQDTLRCRLLAMAPPPTPPPQPVPAPPATVAQIKPYTRVEIADPDVRCVDGTRPILYVDPAVGGPSNRWLIVTTGGEFCAAQDLDHDGSFESGQRCLDDYLAQNGQLMGTANEDAMSTLADDNGAGIMTPLPAINPVFTGYNRVRVHKCGYDRHSGRATHLGVSATPPGAAPFTYDLYNHGQKIVRAALVALRGGGSGNGLSYTTWTSVGGAVTATAETLPSIADATQVLFVGHSAAARGLYLNIDRYAADLRAMPGFGGDVRVVHDAHFQSSAENEAAFDPAQNADPTQFNTLFDQRSSGTTAAAGSYDAYGYYGNPLSRYVEDYRAWLENPGDSYATILDASCVATHTPSNDVWKCRDHLHVRLHHESTPALLREDFSDPNHDHGNVPFGYIMWWSELGAYAWCNAMLGYSPCPRTLNTAQITLRLSVQFAHFRDGIYSKSELATNADTSADSGSIFVWMPRCTHHEGAYNDDQFFGTSLVQDGVMTSYREFMEAFAAAPANGQFRSRVHGFDGALSECGPLLLRNGFE